MNLEHRSFGLDVLRSLAIALVLIAHSKPLVALLLPYSSLLSIGGFWGVELFFTLSGFLVGRILLKTYSETDNLSKRQLLAFWKRRWFRTLPNYYLIFFINIGLWSWLDDFKIDENGYLSYFLFLQNLGWSHPSFFGEAWSLAVEEWFYLTLPLLLIAIDCINLKQSAKNKFLMAIMLLVLVPTFSRFMVVYSHNPDWDAGVRKIVVWRLDAVGTGVLMAWAMFWYNDFLVRFSKTLTLAALLLLTISLSIYFIDVLPGRGNDSSWFSKTLYFNLTSLGFAGLLPLASGKGTEISSWHWLTKFITFFSAISYSVYLIHFSIMLKLILHFMPKQTSVISAIAGLLSYFSFTILISWALYRLFERPMMNLRDR